MRERKAQMAEPKDRISLQIGDELELKFHAGGGQKYTQKAVVEERIGSGASCLTYIVRLFADEKNSSRMIMKEFYPVSGREKFQIQRSGTGLLVSEETKNNKAYQRMLDGFRRAYRTQTELSDSRAMEVMVRPYHMAEYGDSCYILSDMHLGTILARSHVETLSDKLWLMYRTAEAVQLLNEQGYLYIDLNPSNILWIPSQQSVKLFDVDSIVPWGDLDEVHSIRVTYPYTPPELEELNEWFDVNKSVFLKPSWDVYCLGLVFFELLMGRFPTEQDLKPEYEYEADRICRRHGCEDPEAAALIRRILERSLSGKFRMRYPSAKEMCLDLNRLKKMLDAQEFIPKKEYVRANYMMQSYHILDKWPVYEYTLNEDGQEVLDIAICGKQPVREPFFKAAFSCVHMPGMKLRIRLCSDDAAEFMEKLKRENPALPRTVHIYLENKCIWGESDRIAAGPLICEKPMAEIRLYEKSRDEMLADDAAFIRKIESRYLILLWNDTGDEIRIQDARRQKTVIPPVTDAGKCSCYDEKLFGTKIMKRALNVHAFYYRGTHERASWEEIRASFENNVYNMESSMRCALSVRYKLGAAGVGKECENPGEEFYRRVFAAGERTENLAYILSDLEHLSWCAYMVINGWDLPTDSELEEYAFTGENDFKEIERRLHPCLRASRPGNRLKQLGKKQWDSQKLSGKVRSELDDLELTCLKLHRTALRKTREIRPEVNALCDRLERRLGRWADERLQEAFRWLVTVRERVFAGESNAELVWNQAMDQLLRLCGEIRRYDRGVREELKLLDIKMRVVHEYNACHDYKKSDEDIVRGIPGLLSEGKIRIIVRPYLPGRENHWKNILSTLFLEPEETMFIPVDGDGIDVDFYSEFLRSRGCSTRISVCGMEDTACAGKDCAVDVTGLDAEKLDGISRYPALRGRQRIMVKNRKLLGLDNPAVEMYAREIHLTVEEVFYLFGAYMDSDRKENAILGLSSRYHGIWNAYKEIGPRGWKKLIEQLARAEKEKTVIFTGGDRGRNKAYMTQPVSGRALILTGLDLVFAGCLENGLISAYRLPGEEDDLPVEFSTESVNAAAVLKRLSAEADRDPLRHRYVFERNEKKMQAMQETQNCYLIRDRSLYADIFCKGHTASESAEESRASAELIAGGLRRLEEHGLRGSGGRQNLIQKLQIVTEEDGTRVIFKYASEAVKACLQREGNILEAMIYFTCLEMGIFDDLNINSEFSWNRAMSGKDDGYIVNNEIDIIGTKNMKTYFISAKMAVPETAHLTEIKYFADHFGIDGQAVLVTSNSRTADEAVQGADGRAERSRLMGVEYINRTVIDEGRLGDAIRKITEQREESVL